MKTSNHTHQLPTCTCGNQYVLPEGSICEICMGMVFSASVPAEETRFTEAYFEELEEIMDAQIRQIGQRFGAAA